MSSSRLKRILGLGFGLAVIAGSTPGVGILRAPGLVAAQLSSPSTILFAWAGGLYTLLAAICLTELGVMLPRAGGYYVYARHAFGDTVGFAVGWTDWLTYCSAVGYISIGIGEFAAVLVPALHASVRPIAIAVLVALVAVQWAGLRVSSRFQEFTTALKFGAFLAVVAAALAYSRGVAAGAAMGTRGHPSLGSIVAALQAVVITYGGWQSALYFTEEDRDPTRNLPRSMIGGVAAVVVVVVYALVNYALLAVLPIGEIARSTLPAADAAQALFGGRGREMVTVLSLVSLPPTLNALMMIGTRILFAMGRDGLVWRRTAGVTPGGTPGVATIVLAGAAAFVAGTFAGDLSTGAGALALLALGLAGRAAAARLGAEAGDQARAI